MSTERILHFPSRLVFRVKINVLVYYSCDGICWCCFGRDLPPETPALVNHLDRSVLTHEAGRRDVLNGLIRNVTSGS